MIINGNSIEELKKFDDNTVDSVVTDPPYGLSFMGKKWDYDVPSVELWKEVYRVLKPGGHLLSFAGSRTYHRMAVNIEDAGFEIRDQIMWVYGSGFPKSHNIGKAVDKLQGNEREVTGTSTGKGYSSQQEKNKEHGFRPYGQGLPHERADRTLTKGNSPYEGWGTALKPAHEPIVVARKPISEKNIAQNVLKWGTGGINIDGCRVAGDMGKDRAEGKPRRTDNNKYGKANDKINPQSPLGRFPANFIHDGSDEVVGLFPDTKSGKAGVRTSDGFNANAYGKGMGIKAGQDNGEYGDSGSAARFFYTAKASKSERNAGLEGFEEVEMGRNQSSLDGGKILTGSGNERSNTRQNHHPTVKPIKLMQYLVKLVTPKDGICLDPFNGSGTTGIAAKLEGFDYIGIELDPEYCKISKARIKSHKKEIKQIKLV